jgi:hypothetical protein
VFPFARNGGASPASDDTSAEAATSRGFARPSRKSNKQHNIPNTASIPRYIRDYLLSEDRTPLQVPRSFETWATEYLKLNARTENKQSAYSMFMDSGRTLFDKKKCGEMPVDIWFKIPASLQWQWRQSAGVARLAVEDGLKDWKVNDEKVSKHRISLGVHADRIRQLIDAFTEMRKYRSFRPYPTHSLGKIPVQVVRRDGWNRITADRRLPPLTAIATTATTTTTMRKPEPLPPLSELVKSLGSVGDLPKQRPSPGSPAKGPYQGYHYEMPDIIGERKWIIHSVAYAEEEQESASSDDEEENKGCDEDETFSDEGEDEMIE